MATTKTPTPAPAPAAAPTKQRTSALPKLPSLPRMRKPKPPKECGCGCGEMTKGGEFLPGHDSYLKGLALRIERKLMKYSDIEHEGQRKAVQKLMRAGGPASMTKAKKADETEEAEEESGE